MAKSALGMSLAVDIAFYWYKDELAIEFGGESKICHRHVQDLTDYVGIMS